MGASTRYYRDMRKLAKQGNEKAIAVVTKKHNTDTGINARPEQIKKRSESGAKVAAYKRKNGCSPASKGLDYDHKANKFISVASNRGKADEGGRKKKYKRT